MTIIQDTREQNPLAFPADVQVIPGTLATGDYSVKGFEEQVSIERKSLSDLIACITSERKRFKRELLRMRSYHCKAVLIEAGLLEIMQERYRSNVTAQSVIGSIASWQTRYQVPFMLCGNHDGAAIYCMALMQTFLRHVSEDIKAITAAGGCHATAVMPIGTPRANGRPTHAL